MAESEQVLAAEILAEAQKRAERIRQRAEADAQKVIAEARRESEALGQRVMAEAERRAAQRQEVNRAHIRQALAHLRVARSEEMLERIRKAVEQRLAEVAAGPEHRQVLKSLAVLAIGAMSRDRFELILRPQDHQQWGQDLAQQVCLAVREELGRNVQVEVAADSLGASGGLMVRGAGGRELADQTFEARTRRLWGEVRAQLGAVLPQVREDVR